MNKYLLLALFLCGFFFTGYTQEPVSTDKKAAIKAYNEGLYYYTSNSYARAIELFVRAISIDSNFMEAWLLLAEAYDDNQQYEQAIDTYHSCLPKDPMRHPYGYIKLARLEFKIGRYQDAKKSYESFLELKINDHDYTYKAKEGIKRCEFASNLVAHPVKFNPENLGPDVNTTDDEYWPCLTADESVLVITRQIKDSSAFHGMQEDFYFSSKTKDGWSQMRNAGYPLNTGGNEGAQTISGDGRMMVFTACNRSNGFGRCDLYFSVREGDQWSLPKNMGQAVNTKYTETQPSLSADGRELYFASDRPGGKGSVDIYVTKMNELGQWSAPVNIGDSINTRGIDMCPFIHPDNQTLYFSSDQLFGLGGFDLFITRRDSAGNWGTPVNLGYPINTMRDEIGMIVNAKGNIAYYSTNIDPKQGRDIYKFELYKEARPNEVSYMKGKVYDDETKNMLGADFELINLETGNVLYKAQSDSLSGEFLICIPTNHNYLLNVSKEGYLFYSDNFALKGTFAIAEPFLKDIPMLPIKIGGSIVLKNIFFEFNSYLLKDESKIELNKLVRFMKHYSTIKIEISGHTDNVGTEEYNQSLSEDRAKAVTEYLVSSGISSERITFKGYGFSKPVASNETDEGRALNRRTEVTIIEQ